MAKTDPSTNAQRNFPVGPLDGLSALILGKPGKHADLNLVEEAIASTAKVLKIPTLTSFPPVAVFGSARTKEGTPHYKLGRSMGRLLVQNGFSVMTGGGPGMMAAANQGAMEEFHRAQVDGRANSVGISMAVSIKLPFEEEPNPNLHFNETCDYFFPRKIGLVKFSAACVVMPGGIGTLDEAFEVLKLSRENGMPVVFVDRSYYGPLFDWLKNDPHGPGALGLIPPADRARLVLCDTPEEAMHYIQANSRGRIEQFYRHREGLLGHDRSAREEFSWLLNERERTLIDSPAGATIDSVMLHKLGIDLVSTLAFMKQVEGIPVSVLGSSVQDPDLAGEQAQLEYDRIKFGVRNLANALSEQRLTTVLGRPTGLMGMIADTARPGTPLYACDRARGGGATNANHPHIPAQNHHCANYDFSQKLALMKYTAGGIFLPGGFGTLDAFCEMQTLVMCGKVKGAYPLVLLNKQFWGKYLDILKELPRRSAEQSMKGNGYFTYPEIKNIRVTDDPAEAAQFICDGYLNGTKV
jgi:uncharacterized protein (TIGR00730 family)